MYFATSTPVMKQEVARIVRADARHNGGASGILLGRQYLISTSGLLPVVESRHPVFYFHLTDPEACLLDFIRRSAELKPRGI
jgi:hypothetical protein